MENDNVKPTQPGCSQRDVEELLDGKTMGALSDMTRQEAVALAQKSLEALRSLKQENDELRNKYAELLDFLPIGLVTLNGQKAILEANSVVAALLGMERNSLLHKKFQLFVNPDSWAKFDTFFKLLGKTDAKQTLEMKLIGGKSPVYVLAEGVSVKNTDGQGRHIYLAITDITSTKFQEKHLEMERVRQEVLKHNAAGPTGSSLSDAEGTPANGEDPALRFLETLKNNRLSPWFQPILNLSDNRIHHYEALARMYDENGSVVMPSEFIGKAEALGVIDAVDRVIIEKTLRYQTELERRGNALFFSVNLSGKEIGEHALLDFLKAKLLEHGAQSDRFILEITETSAVREFGAAIKFIEALRANGYGILLDNVGVGVSSLKRLQEIKADYVKIDGSFIRDIENNQNNQTIVRCMVEIARKLGAKTIAASVESEAALQILRELGVDYAQGYFIGRSAPSVLA